MTFDREAWRSASHGERLHIADQVSAHVKPPMRFLRLETFAMGTETNEIAIFDCEGCEFSFVPGCCTEIGFDATSWSPTPEEEEDWGITTDEWFNGMPIKEALTRITHSLRPIAFPPMLVERTYFEPAWERVNERDRYIRNLIRYEGRSIWTGRMHRRPVPTIRFHPLETHLLRVTIQVDGSVEAHAQPCPTCSEATKRFETAGLRLPTGDEWEYLCSGGSRTLFRWGDHVPCGFRPSDRTADGDRAGETWTEHRRSNAFGLTMPFNTYDCEVVSDGSWRGGDGGGTSCGGVGTFAEWLTLSTAYNACFDPNSRKPNPQQQGPMRRIAALR